MKTSTMSHPFEPAGAVVNEQRRERHRRMLSLPAALVRAVSRQLRAAGRQRYEMTRERELLGPIGTEIRRAWWL